MKIPTAHDISQASTVKFLNAIFVKFGLNS